MDSAAAPHEPSGTPPPALVEEREDSPSSFTTAVSATPGASPMPAPEAVAPAPEATAPTPDCDNEEDDEDGDEEDEDEDEGDEAGAPATAVRASRRGFGLSVAAARSKQTARMQGRLDALRRAAVAASGGGGTGLSAGGGVEEELEEDEEAVFELDNAGNLRPAPRVVTVAETSSRGGAGGRSTVVAEEDRIELFPSSGDGGGGSSGGAGSLSVRGGARGAASSSEVPSAETVAARAAAAAARLEQLRARAGGVEGAGGPEPYPLADLQGAGASGSGGGGVLSRANGLLRAAGVGFVSDAAAAAVKSVSLALTAPRFKSIVAAEAAADAIALSLSACFGLSLIGAVLLLARAT